MVALEELLLSNCKELKELPNLQRHTDLRKLEVFNRVLIRAVPGLGALVAFEELGVRGCCELGELPNLRMLIHLQSTGFTWFRSECIGWVGQSDFSEAGLCSV